MSDIRLARSASLCLNACWTGWDDQEIQCSSNGMSINYSIVSALQVCVQFPATLQWLSKLTA